MTPARDSTLEPRLRAFAETLPFALDPFQIEACRALASGDSVLVAAPTGSGKTVVGEFAVYLARHFAGRAFYTTPIKALSNQKLRDLQGSIGREHVGLMTGDAVVNADAPVIVMTTEVLRNMLYESSDALVGLRTVVLDEVHYLADRERGAVWEEAILSLPESVQIAALSATVSNAEQFGEWLNMVRGTTATVVSEHRPVPLKQAVMTRRGLVPLFEPGDERAVNRELARSLRAPRPPRNGRRDRRRSNGGRLWRPGVIRQLQQAELLPAIFFIFSRAACDDAVEQCVAADLCLTTLAERDLIAAAVDLAASDLGADDREALGFAAWREAMLRGIAAHHAGLLPSFKETVENLFNRGLVRAVFATETLALGINMPARSVVLERLIKWDGQAHVEITPGEFTQLTGRAGRRGIDAVGYAVIASHPGFDPARAAALASTRTYPLRSSFRASYNTAVNLVHRLGASAARELLETSFAQFQADAQVVGLAARIRKQQQALAGYEDAGACDLGDFAAYWAMRRELSDIERAARRDRSQADRVRAAAALGSLAQGDVIEVGPARRRLPAVVISAGDAMHRDGRPQVLTIDRKAKRIGATDVPGTVRVLARMKFPREADPRSATWRRDTARDLADAVARAGADRPGDDGPDADGRTGPPAGVRIRVDRLRRAIRQHPCHACPDREQHARWWERRQKLAKELRRLESTLAQRQGNIARGFDQVCSLLAERGFLEGDAGEWRLTEDGRSLARLHADQDLLACEAINAGVLDGLSPQDLAAVCSSMTFESRTDDVPSVTRLPRGPVRAALENLLELADELAEVESRHHLSLVRGPDVGLAAATLRWAAGESLARTLPVGEITAGDFVRSMRQLVDFLHQVARAAGPAPDSGGLAHTATAAAALLRRGVVVADAT